MCPLERTLELQLRGAGEDAARCEREGTLLVSFIPLLSTPSFCHNTYCGQFPFIPSVDAEDHKMDLSNLTVLGSKALTVDMSAV